MTEKSLSEKKQKFYFNINIFDEDHVDESELEGEPPPPPVFSEAELIAARKESFEKGKQQGIDEAKASRSELVSRALETISNNISIISSSEDERKKIFEEESVRLISVIFSKLFPLYNEKFGLEELTENLRKILQSQHGAHQISIGINPDAVEGTKKMLEALSSRGLNTNFTVIGDEHLSKDACTLSWTDGGAVIDRQETAQKIHSILKQRLAGEGSKGHDENDIDNLISEDPETKDNTSVEKNDNIETEETERPDE